MDKKNIDKPLVSAKKNYLLPGKPLTPKQLTQLIKSSRNSGSISIEDAHQKIRNSYNKI